MSLRRILKGTNNRDMGRWLFGSPGSFSDLGITTISLLLQIFGILSWHNQEVGKSQNQDWKANPVWSINSGKIKSQVTRQWCLPRRGTGERRFQTCQ